MDVKGLYIKCFYIKVANTNMWIFLKKRFVGVDRVELSAHSKRFWAAVILIGVEKGIALASNCICL